MTLGNWCGKSAHSRLEIHGESAACWAWNHKGYTVRTAGGCSSRFTAQHSVFLPHFTAGFQHLRLCSDMPVFRSSGPLQHLKKCLNAAAITSSILLPDSTLTSLSSVCRCSLLAGQLVHMQRHGAFLVALLVVLRHVHVALCVAGVVGHPHGHRSACDGQLAGSRVLGRRGC